jgi:hypothetical protein
MRIFWVATMNALLTLSSHFYISNRNDNGISQARGRLGVEPVQTRYESVVAAIAETRTQGACSNWRARDIEYGDLAIVMMAAGPFGFAP